MRATESNSSRTQSSHIQIDPSLWHDDQEAPLLGCFNCPERPLCGGLSIAASVFSCLDFCCGRPDHCTDMVCPRNPSRLVARIHEVGGLDFGTIPVGPPAHQIPLPSYIPILYARSKRRDPIRASAVALPLRAVFARSTGRLRFRTRQELAQYFCFSSDAELVFFGIAEDQSLENYWSVGRAAEIVRELATLSPALVTSPNFSLFPDVPRWDNLQNMKRIAICWHELTASGIPAALHLNGRTDRDWERWASFIRDHPEIPAVTFEFGTGAASPIRGRWYAKQLKLLRDRLTRPVRLILKGGLSFLQTLSRCYDDIVFLDSTAYMKTMKRQQLARRDGRMRWSPVLTLEGMLLDNLLGANIQSMEARVRHVLGPGNSGASSS